MVEFSKYFSLLKFSIIHPKEGMDMLTAARQSHEDIKQNISEHTAATIGLEETLIQFFPNNELTKDQLIQNTKELTTHFQNYFEKMRDENFPSKKKPYPTDYSINEDSRLFLYALCKIIKPEIRCKIDAMAIIGNLIVHRLRLIGLFLSIRQITLSN